MACMENRSVVYRGAEVKPEVRRPLWRPKSGWEDNNNIDFNYDGRA